MTNNRWKFFILQDYKNTLNINYMSQQHWNCDNSFFMTVTSYIDYTILIRLDFQRINCDFMKSLSSAFLLWVLEHYLKQTFGNPQALLNFSGTGGKNRNESGQNGFLETCCIRLECIFVELLSPTECSDHFPWSPKINA